jgi:hypothetical protein
MRTGWNASETHLSPSAVKNGSFGLLKTVTLDEQVDAQPLVVSNLQIAGQAHDVAYVVTENNTVYAIDAVSGAILQQRNLGPPVPEGVVDCGNNASVIGITSTPVIDRQSNALYLIAFTLENDQPLYTLHALDLITLADKTAPQAIAGSATLEDGSKYDFNAKVSRQRAALAISNDKKLIYGAFASFCDHSQEITRGWLMGWDAATLKTITSLQMTDHRLTPFNQYLTSIWMSGSGPAIDPSGSVYFITGNSFPDKVNVPAPVDIARTLRESVVKVPADLDKVTDFFTPMNADSLDVLIIGGVQRNHDEDFGSGGILLIPDQPASSAHLAIAAGKSGEMFLLDRDNLGKFDASKDHVFDFKLIDPCWCAQSYFIGSDGVGRVLSSGGETLSSWKIQTSPTPTLVKEWDAAATLPNHVFQKGFFTSVSSDGLNMDTGVVWAVERPNLQPWSLTLWAFDAKTGDKITAIPAGPWPNTGGAANTVPVVANGEVFVASNRELRIFGLGAPAPQVAMLAQMKASAANAQSETKLYGTVVEVNGPTLWLRTRTKMARVDVAGAESASRTVSLIPGTAVTVIGRIQSDGVVQADRIDYAPDSPSLWQPDL